MIGSCEWMSCQIGYFFFQAEDGIRDAQESRGLGDVYKRQSIGCRVAKRRQLFEGCVDTIFVDSTENYIDLSKGLHKVGSTWKFFNEVQSTVLYLFVEIWSHKESHVSVNDTLRL